jgi:hypothetical protein
VVELEDTLRLERSASAWEFDSPRAYQLIAGLAEQEDAPASNAGVYGRAGSIPAAGTSTGDMAEWSKARHC